MSFDLCVWRENRPITAPAALRTYWWLCGDERVADADEAEFGVKQDERVDAFHTELLSAYPPLEGLATAEAEASPWSMTPSHLPGLYVIMMMGFSDAPDVTPVITELAMRHGLVCYDPQTMRIHNPPEIVDTDGLRLEFCDGGIVDDPRPEDLPELLGQITDRNWFAGLERRPGWFMQVGIGERAGKLPDGVFGLEYREGDADRHFRVLVSDLDEVVHAFQGYAEGHERWKAALEWGGATFEDADRANEFEAARAEEYWEARETAADREIAALASAALLMNRRLNGVEITIRGNGRG